MKILLIIISLITLSCNNERSLRKEFIKKQKNNTRFVVFPSTVIDTGGQITNHNTLYVGETYYIDTISLPEITGDTLIHLELNDSSYFEGIEITFDILDADKLIIEYKR
jgi:hypothetical protein